MAHKQLHWRRREKELGVCVVKYSSKSVSPTLDIFSDFKRENMSSRNDVPDLPVDSQRLFSEFSAIVGSENVVIDPAERKYFSRDLFPWDDGCVSAIVVAPNSVDQVRLIIETAVQLNMSVVVRGGGMSTARSYVPADDNSVLIDMRRFNTIREINIADRYVVVESGCTWEQVHAALPSAWTCETRAPLSGNYSTVGGAVAHGYPGGIKGILGVEVVLGNGDILRTGTWGRARHDEPFYREYGPDLTGLFVGDTGAFGVKTAVSLHLIPKAKARATVSFGFESFADVAATLVELAPLDVFTTRFCFDPYDTANLADVRIADAAKFASTFLRSQVSLRRLLRDGASLLSAALSGMPKNLWSINLVAEQFTQESADAAIAAGARICSRRGRQIPNVLALANSTPVYSVRRFLGRNGERWIATHAIFRLSKAVDIVNRTEAFFEKRRAALEKHRIRVGYIAQVTPVHFQIEPLFYWPDELEDLHLRHLSSAEAVRFKFLKCEPSTRAYVLQLRSELRDFFEEMGAVHVHLSKFFRYIEVLQPAARNVLTGIKTMLDGAARINPGNLGLK